MFSLTSHPSALPCTPCHWDPVSWLHHRRLPDTELLFGVFQMRTRRWEGIPSVILSTAHFLLHCEAAVRKRLLVPILEAIVPWTMHHHHATR